MCRCVELRDKGLRLRVLSLGLMEWLVEVKRARSCVLNLKPLDYLV